MVIKKTEQTKQKQKREKRKENYYQNSNKGVALATQMPHQSYRHIWGW